MIKTFRVLFPKSRYGDLSSKYFPNRIKKLNAFYFEAGFIPDVNSEIFRKLKTQSKNKTINQWNYRPKTKDGYIWDKGLLADINGYALTILFPRISHSSPSDTQLEREIEIFSQKGVDSKKAKEVLDYLIIGLEESLLQIIAEQLHANGIKTPVPKIGKIKCDICRKNNKEAYEKYFIINMSGNHRFIAHESCAIKLIKERIIK